jgi:hypothetical protein
VGYSNVRIFPQFCDGYDVISAECENCLFALSPIARFSFIVDDITYSLLKPLDITAAIYSFVTDGIWLSIPLSHIHGRLLILCNEM